MFVYPLPVFGSKNSLFPFSVLLAISILLGQPDLPSGNNGSSNRRFHFFGAFPPSVVISPSFSFPFLVRLILISGVSPPSVSGWLISGIGFLFLILPRSEERRVGK